jgi:hypothetical protein
MEDTHLRNIRTPLKYIVLLFDAALFNPIIFCIYLSLVYVMTPLISQNKELCRDVQERGRGLILNTSLSFSWNELGSHKRLGRNNQFPGRVSNWVTPEYRLERHSARSAHCNITFPQHSVIPQSLSSVDPFNDSLSYPILSYETIKPC